MDEQNIMDEQKPYFLTRETYKRIKAFNRAEMQGFLADIHNAFQKDSLIENIDFDELRSRIGQIKGIGDARLNDIMDVIVDYFESGE